MLKQCYVNSLPLYQINNIKQFLTESLEVDQKHFIYGNKYTPCYSSILKCLYHLRRIFYC